MKTVYRLDKYLADMSVGTRSEVKEYIKRGRIEVNGEKAKKPEIKVDTEKDTVTFDGEIVGYATYEYFMLNKPAGVITATEDRRQETVLDLIEDKKRKDLFPVGRLDKDTEGLLLITNDGDLAHRLLAPKKHVGKKYYAHIKGKVTDQDVLLFKEGLQVEEDWKALPAELTVLESADISKIEIVIYEGKFHQIKRMFEAVEKEVIYLKRLEMGELKLDPSLKEGDYRPLTEEEISLLKAY